MKDLNKAMISGRLGRDVELKTGREGNAIATFSVASNRAVKDEDGNWTDHPEWFRIVAFGNLAERCAALLSKGRHVYVEGRVQTREWEDKEKQRHFITEVIASEMLLLDRRPVQDGGDQGSGDFALAEEDAISGMDQDNGVPF